jgi:aminotransferase in exopolysaccharide biosynthesis
MFNQVVEFIKSIYPNQNPVPLHAPVFLGNEKNYLSDCIDSTYVSYIGKYVTQFEQITARYTGAKFAIAVVNGTAALHIALKVAGVEYDDEVLTQSLTFVATANAISHCGAKPVFVDVDLDTMGMSPEKLDDWLKKNTKPSLPSQPLKCINKLTNKPVSAIVPMHTFGHPCRIDEIVEIANKYNIPVIEDSAESLGSYYKNQHTGTFGVAGILSYNGNKSVTTGGGGMIITNDEEIAKKAKHITTTAKLPHKWEFIHDQIAYNYRLTNLNAAIGLAQMEYYDKILENKRETALLYNDFFKEKDIKFFTELDNSRSNYWLNVIQLNSLEQRDSFLNYTNDNGIITRPVWRLMNKLDIYKNCQAGNLDNSLMLETRVVNLPSSYRQ